MRVLALDLATRAGWAKGAVTSRPQSGVVRLPSTGDDVGAFLAAWQRHLDGWLLDDVDLCVFEAPLLPRTTSFKTVTKLHSLAGLTELICHHRGISCRSAGNNRVKKAWAGHGRAEKTAMVAQAKAYGFAPADDNEADAIAIWFVAHLPDGGPLQHSALVRSWA
jgi:crossover junction endodeoxyribonuclease RuvC